MIAMQSRGLLHDPFLAAAEPLNEIAMTAWAKSSAMFWTGTHSVIHSKSTNPSVNTIVAMEGLPPAPWKQSWKDGSVDQVLDVDGRGMYVMNVKSI